MTPLHTVSLVSALLIAPALQAQTLPAGVKSAVTGERIGLLDAGKLKLTNGACSDCASSPQSLWYFKNDVIAAPTAAAMVAGVTPTLDRRDDIKQWAATPAASTLRYPAVTWLGAPQIIDHARIDGAVTGAATVTPVGGQAMPLALVPKLATNRSFANAATDHYFSGRQVRVRGELKEKDGTPQFIARTIWPADYAIDGARLPLTALVDQFYAEVQAMGGKRWDTSSLLARLEKP